MNVVVRPKLAFWSEAEELECVSFLPETPNCGSCKIRKTRGEVHMVHNGGITDEDVARGYILACCSNPVGRVTVEA
jgi:hypothetical protein